MLVKNQVKKTAKKQNLSSRLHKPDGISFPAVSNKHIWNYADGILLRKVRWGVKNEGIFSI